MKAPSIVRIASIDYRVIVAPTPLDGEKRDVLGRTRNISGQILLDSALTSQEANTTFWHEIVHSIGYRYFYNSMFPQKTNEEYVDRLGEALAQVMRDLGIVFEFGPPP
jgi:hypothetical protein